MLYNDRLQVDTFFCHTYRIVINRVVWLLGKEGQEDHAL